MSKKKKKNSIQQPIRQEIIKPTDFFYKKELCNRLDDFYDSSGIQPDVPPSFLYRGAISLMLKEGKKENPDWMAQVAHSLREILYQFDGGNKRKVALEKFGSTYDERLRIQVTGQYYNLITAIAHHNLKNAGKNPLVGGSKDNPVIITPKLFENIVFKFSEVLFAVFRRQIDAHKEIDDILKKSPQQQNIKEVRSLIELNPDARQFFYFKADERWLDFLWEKGFLNIIKEKSKDPMQYRYNTPEINYLVKMAHKRPKKVVDIILSAKISLDSFNPEVIDRFLHICSALPEKQLSRVIPKIRKEKWIKLMTELTHFGFEFEKMLNILAATKNYNSLINLAETILIIRSKNEKRKREFLRESPFYFTELKYTKVFQHIVSIGDPFLEKAIELTTNILRQIILFNGRKESNVFETNDSLDLYDLDFFSLEVGHEDHLSRQNEIVNLIATIIKLSERYIRINKKDFEKIQKFYKKYIASLSDCRTVWRIQLVILSICPNVFESEIKKAFFRLFEVEKYNELISGTEYKLALKKNFFVLSEPNKREFIKITFEYFSKHREKNKDQDWHKTYGWEILSCVYGHLSKREIDQCKKIFGKECNSEFIPEPSIHKTHFGFVRPKGPITQEKFRELTLIDIARKLRSDWTPKNLHKQNFDEDFLNPINAEGLSELLQEDISRRFQEYVKKSTLFFEKDLLDSHYTCSFLRGVHNFIKNEKNEIKRINWTCLLDLLKHIIESGEMKPYKQEKGEHDIYNTWLSNWSEVHISMTDILQDLLSHRERGTLINFEKYRIQFIEIISYLLSFPDPTKEDEKIKTAKIKTKSPDQTNDLVCDPLTTAINSVRGRAFQALVHFLYQDEKKFHKSDKVKISEDIKEIYKNVLEREDTRALMFMFGHYLPSFYYRDKEWIKGILLQIFPQKLKKKHLYLAAWEGFISNNIYSEIFKDANFIKLYKRGMDLSKTDDPTREFNKEPVEGITNHFAIAFIFYEDFRSGHELFDLLWKKNSNHLSSFINFIGRIYIVGNNTDAVNYINSNPICKKKLNELWDEVLDNFDNPELFKEFGYWIDVEKNIFDLSWLANRIKRTLEKSKGTLDWDYGLMNSIVQLSKESPEDSIEILRLFFEAGISGGNRQIWFHIENDWFEAFKILFTKVETKQKTYSLINHLIQRGGSTFWKLKEIINVNDG